MTPKRLSLAAIALLAIAWIGWQDIPGEFLQRDRNRLTDFGAIANDGKADDDAWAALKANLIATKQYTAIIPTGTFDFEDPIELFAYQILRGDGEGSKIKNVGSGAAVLYETGCLIENLTVVGDDTVPLSYGVAGSIGLKSNSTYPSNFDVKTTIRHVWVRYFESGIYAAFSGINQIDTCEISHATQGLHFAGQQVNAWVVTGGEIHDCVVGVLDESQGGSNMHLFSGVTIEGNLQYGYKRTTAGTGPITFQGCYFEDNDQQAAHAGASIYVDTPGFFQSFSIRGCTFFASETDIDIEECYEGEIDQCSFAANSTTSIDLGTKARGVKVGDRNFFASAEAAGVINITNDGKNNEVVKGITPFQVDTAGAAQCQTKLAAWLVKNPRGGKLPAGLYGFTGTLALPAGCVLEGDGRNRTIFFPIGSFVGPLVTLNDDCIVRGIEFQGTSTALSVAIKPASGKVRWLIDDCQVRLFANGIVVDTAAPFGEIRNCQIHTNTATGLLVSAYGTVLSVHNCSFYSNPLNISVTAAFEGLSIRDCAIYSAGTNGMSITGGAYSTLIDGCRFEGNTGIDLLLSTGLQRGTRITSNRFISTPISIQWDYPFETLVENNTFQPVGGAVRSINITTTDGERNEIGENVWLTGQYDPATHGTSKSTKFRGRWERSGDPTGTGPWTKGDLVWNSALSTSISTASGWLCTTGHASAATFTPFYRAPQVIVGTNTWDPGSLATGASESRNVTVSGAVVGQPALAGLSTIATGVGITATVTTTSNVVVTITNLTATNPIDLGSGTVTVQVLQ